jgi:hypothetical protein
MTKRDSSTPESGTEYIKTLKIHDDNHISRLKGGGGDGTDVNATRVQNLITEKRIITHKN